MHTDAVRVITLRNLPPKLEKRLVATARERGWSLSQTVIRLLEETAAENAPARTSRPDALDKLAGTWSGAEADEFDRVVLAARQIDPELWE
jgi:hypothetical protein